MSEGEGRVETPAEEFHNRIRYLNGFAEKGPRRPLNKASHRGRSGPVRLLSYKEIAKTERDRIKAGENINSKFSGKESIMKRGKIVEKRLGRLLETIKSWINEKTYFSKNLLTKDDCGYITPGSKKSYLDRLVYTDLTVLEKRGKVYSRQNGPRHPKVFYLGKCPVGDDRVSTEEDEMEGRKVLGKLIKEKFKALVPGHITVDVNINITFGK